MLKWATAQMQVVFLFSGCNFNTEIRQFATFAVNYIGIMT